MTKRWLVAGALWMVWLSPSVPLKATTITEGPDLYPYEFVNTIYFGLVTDGNNKINSNQSGYSTSPPSGHGSLADSVVITLTTAGGLNFDAFTHPGTLTEAWLNLANIPGTITLPTWAHYSGDTIAFNPAFQFDPGLATGHFVITVGLLAPLELAPGTTSIDLMTDPAFAAALQSGAAVTVSWRETLTYDLSVPLPKQNDSPNTGCKNCFESRRSNNTDVPGTISGTLTYDYEELPSTVPEPAAAVLLGAGLLALGALRRFC